jgi:T-complex protein 11
MDEHRRDIAEVDLPDLPPNDDIPEESDNITGSDNQPNTFDPPARIAARFFRPSANRRKSSATSSRRNSLSSTHSAQSNSSYRAACRNNHVAQYLRRASILESRKARLAAREAHAEQVRIRAMLAKTAPRLSNSEERALAAQQAREKHLAHVAATCAEEVKRAKRIAEEMKERRAAEEERYRVEMEEKLAEAERRRLEYKRNNVRRPRTASTPPSADIKKSIIRATSQLDREAAVKCLQRAWRTRQRRIILEAFTGLGLSIDRVRDSTITDIKATLCDETVLRITTKLLHLLGIQSPEDRGQDPQAKTRTFLTAYLILGHPTEVMTQDGDQEHDVIQKARDLIISFEAALSKVASDNRYEPSATLLQAFHLSHSAYETTFADWKAKDKTILIEQLVQDFVGLDAIWQTVKNDTDGRVADDYQHAIRENQVQLFARLRKLAGHERAAQLIRKGIVESRRQKQTQRRKPIGDVRPRGANAEKIHPNLNIDSSPSSSAEPLTEFSPTSPVPEDVEGKRLSQLPLSQYFSSTMPSNRVVTHELVIDKDYRIDNSSQSQYREEMNRKICTLMRDAFDKGQGDKWTVATAAHVRHKLLNLLAGSRGQGSMYQLISDTLDPELIQRQCSQGVFSYQSFFNFMGTILPKLCAPVRDEEVKAVAEDLRQFGNLEEMIEKLFKVFHLIDVLSLDYSNFLLSNVAPKLIKEAPEYERRQFAKDLSDGKITLQKTRQWWNNASVNAITEADRLNPDYRPTSQKIYARGLVDLAICTSPLRDTDVPETLELDKARLARMRDHSLRIAVIGSILLGAKNLLKRDVRSQWRTEANRMWDVLRLPTSYADDNTAVRLLSIIDTAHALPPATRAQLQSTITRLLAQAAHAGRLTDPVAKVLFARLKQHVFGRVGAASSGERVKAVSTASESLATAGLPEFGAAVGGMVQLLGRVSDADREAHGAWYELIAAENEKRGEEQEEIDQQHVEQAQSVEMQRTGELPRAPVE